MRVSVRVAENDDWNVMQDIFVQAGQAAWAHILPQTTISEMSAPERWHPDAGPGVCVAEYASEVVGFVCARLSGDEDADGGTGEIDGLYVLPSVWGMGVGQALLRAATDYLAASGFRQATLWTEHRNERPLRVYRAAGWKLDGCERRRTFRGAELCEVRLRFMLNGSQRVPAL